MLNLQITLYLYGLTCKNGKCFKDDPKKCNNIGYYGRIGIFEILDITDEIKELIVKGASTIEIRNKAIKK